MSDKAPQPAARDVVVDAVAKQAAAFPDIHPPTLALDSLEPRDRALAVAIYRTVAQRWISIEYVLRAYLNRSISKVESELRAILLVAGAQLLFMDRLPAYAVVDEAVGQAHRRLRKGAGKLANAVLRRVGATDLSDHLPDPMDTDRFLSIWTSHPTALVSAWRERFGEEDTRALLRHSNVNPPTIVHAPGKETGQPHQRQPFIIWEGSHVDLSRLLKSPDVWVQDPSACGAIAMAAQHGIQPTTTIDLCAGVGTKTRQLLHTFPDAQVITTDVDPRKVDVLRQTFNDNPRVQVVPIDAVAEHQADLLLLDVPCSNTGVLARRPEARYRYRDKTLRSLIDLQRQIITQAVDLLTGGGRLLYTTCSIEPRENHDQVTWAAHEYGFTVTDEHSTLPAGEGTSYHDGAYAALLAKS